MKIAYLADIRLPTEKAHGLQIMETCRSLDALGHEVVLYVSSRDMASQEETFRYYGLEQTFTINKVSSPNLIRFGAIGFRLQSWLFARGVTAALSSEEFDIFYTRDVAVVLRLMRHERNQEVISRKILYEMHDVRNNDGQKRALLTAAGVVVISRGLYDYCLNIGVSQEKLILAPDGVDIEKFDIKLSREEARKKLNLPADKKIILYSGHLYSWKGADILAHAAQILQTKSGDSLVVFVGGGPGELPRFKEEFSALRNILIVGQQPHQTVPLYLKSADILVLPNSAKEKISSLYTSPLKLFEYMAARRPIVASDLPSLREVLNENNALFFKADDPGDLAEKIRDLLVNHHKADKISSQARHDVDQYSWDKRAHKINDFISKL